ncbi:class I SAM-dependent methyltransferase [Lichenicoccus sp.]|uniref:class I SAM-dependent methyltransferase n=1 Tax=Lichenicoccus sp. TaxID=2781899 RepID=UPI003D0EF22D
MAEANAAYYAQRDPFADFTTSPEISQVFGEILGAWVAVVWRAMGAPARLILAEAGPGRGTLMADALRLLGRMAPDCMAAVRLHLIETSPRLRAAQRAALAGAAPTWHDRLDTLPDGPLILLANEFLDALPIRQFRHAPEGWQERHVEAGASCWDAVPALCAAPVGSFMARCEPARAFITSLARRLMSQGGAALLLDYGSEQAGTGDTLQALKDGAPCDPFGAAGEADLTAHVDFAAVAEAARGVRVYGPVPQGRFLGDLGLFARTERLARSLPPEAAAALGDAAHRLAHPDRMGALFKAMALCHPDLPEPPGFAV